jgi:hypothetical protein
MNDVMPRYLLENRDMALLIAYLKSLSSQLSPGVSETTLRFATVISEDVAQEDRDALLVPLENYVKNKNDMARFYKTPAGSRGRQMVENMLASKELALRNLSLSRWILKGAPETWRSQLEEYYRKEPVFALLGGMTNGEWAPVHRFSEENRIPCLFPMTDFPVISDTDWYTMYLSKGYYQEGEAAARYLSGFAESFKGKAVIQVSRDSGEGRALSAGFRETWSDLGQQAPASLTLKRDEALTGELLSQLVLNENPAV